MHRTRHRNVAHEDGRSRVGLQSVVHTLPTGPWADVVHMIGMMNPTVADAVGTDLGPY